MHIIKNLIHPAAVGSMVIKVFATDAVPKIAGIPALAGESTFAGVDSVAV
jgi:hypothetical protein